MIRKKPAPDLIRGGYRFSETIMLEQQAKAKYRVTPIISLYSGQGGLMRATTLTLSLSGLLFAGAFSLSLAQPAQPAPAAPVSAQPVPWHPCAQIREACQQAGFVPNGAKTGIGIAVDCIRPIMDGTPQRSQATKPLPAFDPRVVSACKERSPNFGMDRGQSLFALRAP